MARKAKKATHVDRLRKAGVLRAGKLPAKHERAITKLSQQEVAALLRVSRKMGKAKVRPPAGRAWFVIL